MEKMQNSRKVKYLKHVEKPGRHSEEPATKVRKSEVSRGLTFWLFIPAFTILAGTTCSFWLGRMSMFAASMLLIPTYYFMAMCVHDAIHRAAHANPLLNRVVGWIAAATMALTFPTIRRSHLNHHASFGHDHDDEGFVYRAALTLPFRLLLVNWRCYGILVRSPRREQVQAGALLICIAALLCWQPIPLFWGWLIPMQIGVALFALMTVYLPHGPYSRWIMKHVPAITGFHDDHHAMPQLPWYQHFVRRTTS